jgi:hypothetical protein
MTTQTKETSKKLNAKDRYRALTRDLDWDFSYADRKDASLMKSLKVSKLRLV